MAIQGEIKTLYTDSSKERVLLPVTKTKAITDDQGINLDVLLASKASESFVTNKIAEAQLSGGSGGGDIDLSGYVTKDELNTAKGEINQTIAALDYDDVISSTLPTNKGGTGRDMSAIPANAIIRKISDGTTLTHTATASGALYATSENGIPTFGTLPIAQGGTGATTALAARKNLGAKIFFTLAELGITTFPTTMATICSKMPNNSTLIIDSRNIIADGAEEISDLGLGNAGMYLFMKGNTTARLSLLHIYGATSATTSYQNFGCYAATNNTVTWRRVVTTVLTSNEYGTALPTAGTKGRMFFKKV